MSVRSFSSLLPWLLAGLLVGACTPSAEGDGGVLDAGDSDDGGRSHDAGEQPGHDAGHDAGTVDAGTDAGQEDDAGSAPDAGDDGGAHDAGADDGGSDDAGSDDAGSDDAGAPGPLEAVRGERCAPEERVGLVEVTSWGADTYYLSASLASDAPPWLGPPEATDGACAFYDGAAGCACSGGEVCAFEGGCAPLPGAVEGLTVRLRAGGAEQVFEESDVPGRVEGTVTLAGSTFRVELVGGDVELYAAEMTVPAALAGGQGQLDGDYMTPEGIDLSWTPTAAGVDVFTHVPMNHHVGTPTFTECRVAGSEGELHIPGAMLQPLAVSTGLEFQTVDTAAFAAATTALGCVEVRFSRKAFVALE